MLERGCKKIKLNIVQDCEVNDNNYLESNSVNQNMKTLFCIIPGLEAQEIYHEEMAAFTKL